MLPRILLEDIGHEESFDTTLFSYYFLDESGKDTPVH